MFKKLKKFSLENNVVKVGIEYPSSYGMPAGQTLFDTCTFCGILCQLFLNIDIKPELIFRKVSKNVSYVVLLEQMIAKLMLE